MDILCYNALQRVNWGEIRIVVPLDPIYYIHVTDAAASLDILKAQKRRNFARHVEKRPRPPYQAVATFTVASNSTDTPQTVTLTALPVTVK